MEAMDALAMVGAAVIALGAVTIVAVPAAALLIGPDALARARARTSLLASSARAVRTTRIDRALTTRVVAGPCDRGEREAAGRRPQRGAYRLDELLSQSATAQVWRALDVRTGTVVAFKCPLPGSAGGVSVWRAADRLVREGVVLAAVRGPRIVGLHEAGTLEGAPFVAMRFAGGPTLLEVLAEHPRGMAPTAVAEIVGQVADALGCTHRAGFAHRDVKPSNVIYDPTASRWLLCDFGIAQPLAEPALDRLTAPGFVVGTPGHLAPELLRHDDGDAIAGPATDGYALAVLAHQLLTGALPRPARRMRPGRAAARAAVAPPSQLRPELGAIDDIFTRALAADPEDRYPDPGAFAHTLARVVATLPRDLPGPHADNRAAPGPPADATPQASSNEASPLEVLRHSAPHIESPQARESRSPLRAAS